MLSHCDRALGVRRVLGVNRTLYVIQDQERIVPFGDPESWLKSADWNSNPKLCPRTLLRHREALLPRRIEPYSPAIRSMTSSIVDSFRPCFRKYFRISLRSRDFTYILRASSIT